MGYFRSHLIFFERKNDTKNSRHVNVTFEQEQFQTGKTLLVRLSDENDLYFLYSCRISHEEFASIKNQQGLLVEFSGFEQKVIDLLDLCLQAEGSSNPRYTLKFSPSELENEGLLQIIEATNFKYLVHLSLTLRAADDEALKAYLVTRLKSLKVSSEAELTSLRNSIADFSTRLSDSEKALKLTSNELVEHKANSQLREENLKRGYEQRLRLLEESYSQAEAERSRTISEEKRLSAQACEDIRHEMNSKIDRLLQENQEIKDERDQLQAKVKRISNQLADLEEQLASQSSEALSLRSKLMSTEQMAHTKTSDVNRLESRLSILEQEILSKDQLLSKTQELLKTEQEQKSRLQEELQQNSRQLEKAQTALGKEKEEVNKANEIIKRLQGEVKSHHTKAKLRGQVAAEQERLLTSKDTELQEQRTELDRLKRELKESKDSISQLTEQLKSNSAELADAQQTIKTNENIISWLNRQISENQIGNVQHRLRSSGYPTPITAFGGTRPFSPSGVFSTNSANVQIAPPWYPSAASAVPCSTIISRSTSVPPTTSPNILPSCVPSSTLTTSNASNGALEFSSKASACFAPASQALKSTVALRTNGVTGRPLPSHSESSNLAKKPDARLACLPAPITKSTPLHADCVPHSVGGTDPTVSGARSGPIHSSYGQLNPLPTYIPSALLTKSHQAGSDAAIPGTTVGTENRYSVARHGLTDLYEQDDIDRAAHQQSLTSAYFPNPVGTGDSR